MIAMQAASNASSSGQPLWRRADIDGERNKNRFCGRGGPSKGPLNAPTAHVAITYASAGLMQNRNRRDFISAADRRHLAGQ